MRLRANPTESGSYHFIHEQRPARSRFADGTELTQQDLLLAIMDAVESAGTARALPTQASIDYGSERPPAPSTNGSHAPLAPDRFARQS